MKNPIGLDHLTSSRYLDFLERSHGFDAYYNRNNGFCQGIMVFGNTENERMTWQGGVFRYSNTVFGFNTGDDEYMVTGRLTCLPYYCDEGRYMIHLGMGAQYGRPDENTVNLNTRWLLRNGSAAQHNTVAIAVLDCTDQVIVNPEFFMNCGPLSIQAEYIANFANEVNGFRTQIQPATATTGIDYFSQSAYVQAMYFLTGEHRPYGKTATHGSGAAPTRVIPYRNYFWVPGQGCGNPFSCGAWQVGARYSWIDLSNNGINGGTLHEVTLGLNWFLNPNIKFQWNYDFGHRLAEGATSNGTYQGFGMRMAMDF